MWTWFLVVKMTSLPSIQAVVIPSWVVGGQNMGLWSRSRSCGKVLCCLEAVMCKKPRLGSSCIIIERGEVLEQS